MTSHRYPRETVLRLAGEGSRLELTLKHRRWGYLLSSGLTVEALRVRLRGSYALRVLEVHAASGRFFLEPSSDFLLRGVSAALESPHRGRLEPFFTPQRRDRLRRLGNLIRARGRCAAPNQQLGSLVARRFFLRLECLPWSRRPERLVAGLGRDFDELWSRGRLERSPLCLNRGPLSLGFSRLRDLGDEIAALGEKGVRELTS